MNIGGITARIISFANACVGRFSGGFGLTTVMSCMVFSGVSGSAVADATALGKVLIPGMKRSGYDPGFAASITTSASVMGPILPRRAAAKHQAVDYRRDGFIDDTSLNEPIVGGVPLLAPQAGGTVRHNLNLGFGRILTFQAL
jgi:hypothetical protein